MTKASAARKWLLATALAYLGLPYRWGGDDPSGFDCSGFVIECLRSAGLIPPGDRTADGLLDHFLEVRVVSPDSGCLLFRLNEHHRAIHVSICLDAWFQIGAAGGDRSTRNNCVAWEQNAFVKIRPIRYDPAKYVVVNPLAHIKE